MIDPALRDDATCSPLAVSGTFSVTRSPRSNRPAPSPLTVASASPTSHSACCASATACAGRARLMFPHRCAAERWIAFRMPPSIGASITGVNALETLHTLEPACWTCRHSGVAAHLQRSGRRPQLHGEECPRLQGQPHGLWQPQHKGTVQELRIHRQRRGLCARGALWTHAFVVCGCCVARELFCGHTHMVPLRLLHAPPRALSGSCKAASICGPPIELCVAQACRRKNA